MNQDFERLQAYTCHRDENAFREIVDKYAGMVFSTARRRVGNAQIAEEIAHDDLSDENLVRSSLRVEVV